MGWERESKVIDFGKYDDKLASEWRHPPRVSEQPSTLRVIVSSLYAAPAVGADTDW
jgi:hypothetical protein